MSREERRSSWCLENEIEEDEKLLLEDVRELKNFCSDFPKSNTVCFTDNVLVALLHCCDYNLNQAKIVATKYFKIRSEAPEVFANRHVDSDELRAFRNSEYLCVLPRRHPDGRTIVFYALRKYDVSLINLTAATKARFLTIDACIHENPTASNHLYIIDMKGVSFKFLFKLSFPVVSTFASYMQEGIPLKMSQIHFFNSSSITQKMVQLARPFLKKELIDSLIFHTGGKEEMLAIVPKECLPSDYGGDLPDLETLQRNHVEWLRPLQPRMDAT